MDDDASSENIVRLFAKDLMLPDTGIVLKVSSRLYEHWFQTPAHILLHTVLHLGLTGYACE